MPGAFKYQWKKNGVNVGTNSARLTLTAVSVGDNGAQITCVITDRICSRTSSTAVLTVFATPASCSGGGTGFEAPAGSHSPPDAPDPGMHPVKNTGGVYLHSGEFYLEATDLRISGRGFDFVWSRKYRSREGRLTAMGDRWDFSYNRVVTPDADGTGRYVYDGNSRRDDYRPISTSCWAASGFFRELCQQVDGSYLLTFPNKTTWRFADLDAPVAPGKISEVRDRNGNTMAFSYDGSGRLSVITDTLSRTITVSYNTSGFISAVTDFTGRQVTYGYFGLVDSGGTPTDLRSVTTPAVTGQQQGNNFPNGKTTTYTYTTYMAEPALNHNLLTVTDPLGQTYIRNIYTTTEDPSNGRFDRLDRQRLPNGTIGYVYIQQTPSPGNSQAVTKTIVNDRAGNVREVFYNSQLQAVMLRAYTGRAPDPSLPTDDSFNRPVSPLRSTDPPFFERRYSYNADSLLTDVVLPEGNSVQHTYDTGNPSAGLLTCARNSVEDA